MKLLSATFLLLSSSVVSAALRGAGLEREQDKHESIGNSIDMNAGQESNLLGVPPTDDVWMKDIGDKDEDQDQAKEGASLRHRHVPANRRLIEKGKACSFDGQKRQAGQWLKGPLKICQCDRHGSGSWVACVDTPVAAVDDDGGDVEPNTAIGRRQQFDKEDFVFDLLGSVPASITSAGTIQSVDVVHLPSLAGQGLSYSLFTIEPCGINLPHVHPRATELLYMIGGKDLRTAFVEENGGRVIVNDIGMGEVTFFPEGLVHYQQNLSCETVTYISALNSEDPGVITVSTQFFRLPNEAVQGSIGQDEDKVQQLIDGLPSGPAEGHSACMVTCGL